VPQAVADAGGNPFAALDLSHDVSPSAGGPGLSESLRVPQPTADGNTGKRPPPQAPSPAPPAWRLGPHGLRIGAYDVAPFEDATQFWRSMAQFATIAMALIAIGFCLSLARDLIVPILGALVIGLTLGPLAGAATRHGLPSFIPALIIVAAIATLLYLAALALSDPLSDLMSRSAEIAARIKEKFRFMERPLATLRDLRAAIGGGASLSVDASEPAQVIGSVLGAVTPALVQFVLFFATLFFFIFGRSAMRRGAVNVFSTREGRLRALRIVNDIERSLSGYLITVTTINAFVGAFAALVTWMLGFPAPLLWGALAFLLNYIPYVGPGLMQVTLFVIGLLTFDTLLPALVAPAIFMAFTFVEGHFLVPNIIGRQLLLHPLAVFLSLAFWSWMWGPVGAFLATPILIMAVVVADHLYPRTRMTLPD
jgi:predicted PurR-regulated permease PerM